MRDYRVTMHSARSRGLKARAPISDEMSAGCTRFTRCVHILAARHTSKSIHLSVPVMAAASGAMEQSSMAPPHGLSSAYKSGRSRTAICMLTQGIQFRQIFDFRFDSSAH